MSISTSMDTVDASYWTYVAAVMVERLDKIISTRRVRLKDIPKSVLRDAEEFFRLVLEASGDSTPDNPPASINAYLIATDVAREASPAIPDGTKIEGALEKYAKLLEKLKVPHVLDEKELSLAQDLRRFFVQLHQSGEDAEYERRFENGSPVFRLIPSILHR